MQQQALVCFTDILIFCMMKKRGFYSKEDVLFLVFSSTIFLFVFLPLVLIIYYQPWLCSRTFRNRFLLLASLLFYAWGEPVFVFLMIFSIIVGWFIGRQVGTTSNCTQKERQRWLICGVTFHVGLLFVFKYLTFIMQEARLLLHADFSPIHITLPIGISFFTFQLLSYLFDIYYNKAQAQRSVLNVGLYIALFPQLIAGPIVRYDNIEKQIDYRQETLHDFTDGMMRFIYGLGKKVLIADYMAIIADDIFGLDVPLSTATAWIGAAAYTLQIYFDFSGYSDMAIGLGQMFGFHFPENFNYPYVSRSISEFWRRWHISLGAWFRDYVYIPLGGNRVTKLRWGWNLFIVWALTGIWHGANWTYLCWGILFFVLILFEKITHLPERLGIFAHVYAIVVIVLSFALFRAPDLHFAAKYIGMMFGHGSTELWDFAAQFFLTQGAFAWFLAIVLSLPVAPYLQHRFSSHLIRRIGEPILATGIFLLSLLVAISSSYHPFIYFNF